MSDELGALYPPTIVEHGKRPHNLRRLEGARAGEAYNPLCGDRLTVYVDLADGVLREVTFHGSGCAVSTASASLMTEALQGKSATETAALADAFCALVTAAPSSSPAPPIGELAAFAGVHTFPSRVKCALLPWQALRTALAQVPGRRQKATTT
jgi:nitrogen fixation NifU-like protein